MTDQVPLDSTTGDTWTESDRDGSLVGMTEKNDLQTYLRWRVPCVCLYAEKVSKQTPYSPVRLAE